MNKNQKQIRRFAAKNNGESYRVVRAYDQTSPNNRIVGRIIPVTYQPRKSEKNCAKVARKGSKLAVE